MLGFFKKFTLDTNARSRQTIDSRNGSNCGLVMRISDEQVIVNDEFSGST